MTKSKTNCVLGNLLHLDQQLHHLQRGLRESKKPWDKSKIFLKPQRSAIHPLHLGIPQGFTIHHDTHSHIEVTVIQIFGAKIQTCVLSQFKNFRLTFFTLYGAKNNICVFCFSQFWNFHKSNVNIIFGAKIQINLRRI